MTKDEIITLLDRTYSNIVNSEGTESYFVIDGQRYNTDVGYAIDGIKIYIELIKKALEQESKIGYWVKDPHMPMTAESYVCSQCGFSVRSNFNSYCPNCGAKMESEKWINFAKDLIPIIDEVENEG